jgi:hypothetical protein
MISGRIPSADYRGVCRILPSGTDRDAAWTAAGCDDPVVLRGICANEFRARSIKEIKPDDRVIPDATVTPVPRRDIRGKDLVTPILHVHCQSGVPYTAEFGNTYLVMIPCSLESKTGTTDAEIDGRGSVGNCIRPPDVGTNLQACALHYRAARIVCRSHLAIILIACHRHLAWT